MKIDNKIILYFDDQLNQKEKNLFEKEIKNSIELQNQIKEYKIFLSQVNETKNISVDDDYFVNLIPRFKNKLESKTKRKFNLKFIYAFSTIIIAVVSFLIIFNVQKNDVNYSLQDVLSNMNQQEISQTLNDDFNDIISSNTEYFIESNFDSTLNSMFANELNMSSESAVNLLLSQNDDSNKLYDNIDDNEAGTLYTELLNKKF